MVSPTDIAGAPLVEWAFEFDLHGKFIVYASNENDDGILQLYQKFLDSDQPPRQLTKGDDPVKKGFLSPQGDKLVILYLLLLINVILIVPYLFILIILILLSATCHIQNVIAN